MTEKNEKIRLVLLFLGLPFLYIIYYICPNTKSILFQIQVKHKVIGISKDIRHIHSEI